MRLARAEKNIIPEELTKLAGVSRQTSSSIETCQYILFALKPVEEQFFLAGDDA